MRFNYILIVLLPTIIFSQFGDQNIISDVGAAPRLILTADFDNDNDIDVYASLQSDDQLIWFENLDGLGTFSTSNVIGTIDSVRRATLVDIDIDGDIDVIGVNTYTNSINLYLNTGAGGFTSVFFIDETLDSPYGVTTGDMDNDGDEDLIVGSDSSGLNYIENLFDGTTIAFASPVAIDASLNVSRSVVVFDIENDGDLDVVSTSSAGSADQVILSWFENLDGFGNFGVKNSIVTGTSTPHRIINADFNNDNFTDFAAIFPGINRVVWYENMNGNGGFGDEQLISTLADDPFSLAASDFNNDGAIDIVVGSVGDHEVSWFSNDDGLGNFGAQQIITTDIQGLVTVATGDIDGDGSVDVLSSSILDDKLAWYRNELFLDLPEQTLQDVTVFPNPAHTSINVKFTNNQPILNVTCYTLDGRFLFSSKNTTKIDVSSLLSGMYFLRITDGQTTAIQKFVKE
ncbi:T9SS type A sorting domain-containing protein [Patiriisocius marinus]|uniref:Secretion system C-terminal sorting domain-containing protein n=1 Tax=Patiriisocius marinus TaxID=1397112 RepID=A0A5J4J5I0_9FLAO|nr:T9SS type A sorting domain-containing protein [Patiriisocius marinus]GER59717.1 hypothetical protein ULMA_18250 [Patiriisocius marinus]